MSPDARLRVPWVSVDEVPGLIQVLTPRLPRFRKMRDTMKRDSPMQQTPMGVALAALSRRDMTGAEISRLLLRKGFPEDTIEIVIEEITHQGLVQDSRTAGFVVTEVKDSKFKGRLAASNKLEKRGVDPTVAKEALAALPAESDREKALNFLASKPWKDPSQAARALAVRGFEEDCILSVIEEVFSDE